MKIHSNPAEAASRAHHHQAHGPHRHSNQHSVRESKATAKAEAKAEVKAAKHVAHHSSVNETGEPTRAHGVIRLLQEGHFKGVADVRLRMNFHQEISQMERAAENKTAQASFDNLVETVGSNITTLLDSGALTPDQAAKVTELHDAFKTNADEALNQFLEPQNHDADALASNLRAAFDAFSSAIHELVIPDETEAITPLEPEVDPVADNADQDVPDPVTAEPDQDVPDPVGGDADQDIPDSVASDANQDVIDPVSDEADAAQDPAIDVAVDDPDANEEPQLDLSAFLAQMTETFSQGLDDLASDVRATDVLPPLSPPNGNGVAYARFVEMYSQMRLPDPEPVPAPTVDAQA